MPACSQCGTDNPDIARFCLACGSPLAAAPPPQEVRKVVSIVFSDLKGSTSMGERLDSESLREVMSRYFEAMRAELERHGGVVEKFIGDAIMAVFGLPRLHEDDALRAVRAAAGMQRRLAGLNDDLERHWGVRLTVRTGVNTGEVVAGDPAAGQRLVTGDAVNVAARLEQAAGAQEILLGPLTYRLVRDYVQAEAVEPLELKGKAERVPAYRLVHVREDAERPRRLDAPMVGRDRELALLGDALREAVEGRCCRLVTVVGEAGVGKSRLVDELARGAGEARALRGRCLPYGDGITYWPLAEAVRGAAGIGAPDPLEAARAKLRRLGAEEEAVARVESAIGLAPTPFPVEELAWGARRLLEALARERPLLVLFEDVHWAEPTFLELVERVVEGVADAPLLVVCTTRHELVERRPDWGEGERGRRIVLERLADEQAVEVAEHLLGEAGIDEEVRRRIVQAAEGNPLFVEQLLSMLVDDGLITFQDGRWRPAADLARVPVPPTIHALLAARLDRLAPDERAVIEPASVVGLVFPHDAVRHLAPERVRPELGALLEALAAKQLVRPDLSQREPASRFHHILVRDTAYEGILKRARAALHEAFVEWADAVNREGATEYEEILGYHLEQAYRYRAELGPLDEHGIAVGVDAARRLAGAGSRAFQRGDMPAAASLLGRAAALFPGDDARRFALLPTLAEALMEIGGFEEARPLVEEALGWAAAEGSIRVRAEAVIVRLLIERHSLEDLDAWMGNVIVETGRLIPELEAIGADAELARAWRLVGLVHASVLNWEGQAEAHRRALEHARRAGDARLEARLVAEYTACLRDGPTPVAEAARECEKALERGLDDRQARAFVLCSLARLRAMDGKIEEARRLIAEATRLREELGPRVIVPLTSLQASRVELLAGDPAGAERALRDDYGKLAALGDRYVRPLVGALLARALYEQGRREEAAALHAEMGELADADDVETQALLRSLRARLLADAGEPVEAEASARQAVGLLAEVESLDLRGDCLLAHAETLAALGRGEEARAALEAALEAYTRKGNDVSAGRARALLEARPAVAAS
ncbi:MAG TPA: AAA family ATPase [Gaiellaceae bacterium]|nr:AAA family ATPase [Gaiellaceae bacterium]